MLFRKEKFDGVEVIEGVPSEVKIAGKEYPVDAVSSLTTQICNIAKHHIIVDLQFSYNSNGNPCALVLYRKR